MLHCVIDQHSPARLRPRPAPTPPPQAIEYSQKGEKVPSCILRRSRDGCVWGGLYHGGFKAVMNTPFLKEEGVTHIVNTAKGLEIFGPKYLVRMQGGVEWAGQCCGVGGAVCGVGGAVLWSGRGSAVEWAGP